MGGSRGVRRIVGILSILGNNSDPVINGFLALAYFGSGAFTLLRSVLLSYAVAVFLSELLLKLTATLDTSAWYFRQHADAACHRGRARNMGPLYRNAARTVSQAGGVNGRARVASAAHRR